LTGSSRAELVGSVSSESLRWEQPELVEHWFAKLGRNEEVREASTKIRHASGASREVLVSLMTLSLGGQPHVLLQAQDVSGRRLLERQLIQAQKMEAVGQLAAGVAHDFNNILAATLMELDLLLMEPDLKPEVRNGLGNLRRDNERAASLTRQLLMFSRRQAMQVKSLDLNAVLSEGIKMLRRLLGEHIELRVQAASKEVWIEADAGMMYQLIMNLCINARDAMPKGGILTVGVKELVLNSQDIQDSPEARAGSYVVLTVADNGTGMSVETMNRIFEPFFTTKDVGKGSGLGLATAYGIVKQHRGWIEVTSQVGAGSEFRVWLPTGSKAAMVAAAAPPVEILPGTGTILVVEDEAPLRTTMRKSLTQANYRVFTAASGKEALEQWRDKMDQINLLLTDMVMPGGMTGLELAEECRKLAPRLRVIITSGYSDEILQSGVPTEKGFVYLPKPCGARELVATVRKLLEGV
jgi:signal transduction histidine kinase